MEKLSRRSIRVGLLAAPFLLLLGATADGHGAKDKLIYACVDKHDGDVRIVSAREHCRRRENRLSWPREVPPPAPAPAPGPAPAGPAAVEVVDSQGVVLGPVVSMNMTFPILGIRRNGTVFPFMAANMAGFASLSGLDKVFFSGQNCDGAVYMAPSFSPFPSTGVDQNGNGYGYPGGEPGTDRVNSSFGWEGCQLEPNPPQVAPALQLFTASSFTPPFTVR
jgi:hypothetical protein